MTTTNLMKYFSILFFTIHLIGCSPLKKTGQDDSTQLYPSEKVVTPYHNEWTVGHYKSRIKTFKENPLKYGDIVFIGNSITEQGRNWSEKFGQNNIKNRGIAGDVTDGVLARLNEITHFEPQAVFLLIGINDLSNYHQKDESRPHVVYHTKIPSPEYVGNNIIKIAKEIHRESPNTKIYIQTLLPNSRPNMKASIHAVNDIIRENEYNGNYQVIDLHQHFTNPEGLMKKELTKDGTHLNEKGYEVWVEAVKALMEKLALRL